MRSASKRSVKGSPLPNVPAIDDVTLVRTVLSLPIGATLRKELLDVVDSLVVGKFGQLPKADRDRLMRLAIAESALPRAAAKPKGVSLHTGHPYEVKRTKGTVVAEGIISAQIPALGGRMPVPPGRRA